MILFESPLKRYDRQDSAVVVRLDIPFDILGSQEISEKQGDGRKDCDCGLPIFKSRDAPQGILPSVGSGAYRSTEPGYHLSED